MSLNKFKALLGQLFLTVHSMEKPLKRLHLAFLQKTSNPVKENI